MNITMQALAAAEKRLKLFKRAAQDAKEYGWTLRPEELWEQDDDAALNLIERAQADAHGHRPLFCDEVAS